ncbi:MAG: hypothetical protein FJ320_05050 [SAR202 cluster bacterium]|nr:hypothetical protein [SAR202 cluster bacterium]
MGQSVAASNFCVLDIETCRGDFDNYNPADFMLLVTGTMDQVRYVPYECNKQDLGNLADFLNSYSGTIVTFNGTRFDFAVLDVYFKKFLGSAPKMKKHYDIMAKFQYLAGFRVKLDTLCSETLGISKIPWDHTQNEGVFAKQKHRLLEYNEQDLTITSRLYQRILAGQPLIVDNKRYFLPKPLP